MSPLFVPLFVLLFASWMLWGWVVGESKDIKWLRIWCAPTFVITAMLISAGAGAGITKALTEGAIRANVAKLLAAIELRIQAGEEDRVLSEIGATNHTDDPDADAFDLLKHLPVMEQNLSPQRELVAERDDGKNH